MNNNPLQQYFRAIKYYIQLPSRGNFYDEGIVQLNDDGEVGVMAMTSKDELMFSNPEALINGEAVLNAIRSCVPAVKKPEKLLANDADALMIAIRHASLGDSINVESKCPECSHSNTYSLNTEYTLGTIQQLEEHYVVNLDNGLSVFVSPFSYEITKKALGITHEQSKVQKFMMDETLTDDERIKMISKYHKFVSDANTDIIVACITKAVSDVDNVLVNDKKHIREFVLNADSDTIKKLDEMIQSINSIGAVKTFTAVCEKCKHTWKCDIDYNPSSFFRKS